jgi:hypothetical protein
MRWSVLALICLLGCEAPPPAAAPTSSVPSAAPASPEEEKEARRFAAQCLADHGAAPVSAAAAASSDGVRLAEGTWVFEGRVGLEDRGRVDYTAVFVKERGTWKTMMVSIAGQPAEGDIHLVNRQLERARRMRSRQVSQRADDEQPELRAWTSGDAKFSVEASFLSRAADKVKLRKADGTEISVPLDRLSDDDRQWLRDYERSR